MNSLSDILAVRKVQQPGPPSTCPQPTGRIVSFPYSAMPQTAPEFDSIPEPKRFSICELGCGVQFAVQDELAEELEGSVIPDINAQRLFKLTGQNAKERDYRRPGRFYLYSSDGLETVGCMQDSIGDFLLEVSYTVIVTPENVSLPTYFAFNYTITKEKKEIVVFGIEAKMGKSSEYALRAAAKHNGGALETGDIISDEERSFTQDPIFFDQYGQITHPKMSGDFRVCYRTYDNMKHQRIENAIHYHLALKGETNFVNILACATFENMIHPLDRLDYPATISNLLRHTSDKNKFGGLMTFTPVAFTSYKT